MNRLLICLIMLSPLWCFSQTPLKAVEDGAASVLNALGGGENAITAVNMLSETDKTVTLEITFKGFKDKKYTIKGQLQDKFSKALKELEVQTLDLPQKAQTLELTFTLKPQDKAYSSPYLESAFVAISIYEAGGAGGSLSEAFGDLNLSGNSYKYKLNKRWRVGGTANMIVEVKLNPIGKAATLQQ